MMPRSSKYRRDSKRRDRLEAIRESIALITRCLTRFALPTLWLGHSGSSHLSQISPECEATIRTSKNLRYIEESLTMSCDHHYDDGSNAYTNKVSLCFICLREVASLRGDL